MPLLYEESVEDDYLRVMSTQHLNAPTNMRKYIHSIFIMFMAHVQYVRASSLYAIFFLKGDPKRNDDLKKGQASLYVLCEVLLVYGDLHKS